MEEILENKEPSVEDIIILPLRGCPVFPGICTSVEVSDKQDIACIKEASENYNSTIGLLQIKPEAIGKTEITADDFYSVGTTAYIKKTIVNVFNSKSIYVETVRRFKVITISFEKDLVKAKVVYPEETAFSKQENKAFTGILKQLSNNADAPGITRENLMLNINNIPDAAKLTDFLCTIFIEKDQQQEYLENLDTRGRITSLIQALQDNVLIDRMRGQIQASITSHVDRRQKEILLREELSAIKSELEKMGSDGDSVEELSDDYIKKGIKARPSLIDRLKALNLSGEAEETVFEEYDKYSKMDTVNPERSILQSYLELVADLPWNNFSEEYFDIEEASSILEKDHYGIADVKKRILEFLAVRKLKQDIKGSIICLIGPPGTGKTSIGISIAKALHKQYYRFSVGGMRDEAEIKGHRRTYLGSMPGQIIKGLKVTKTKNPVFVIDEIDKMTSGLQGDPASALLEVLDPEQNSTFRDHYLDIPFDVSNVLFIVTANSTDTIPRPLLDRMEIIELNGYTPEEKVHIGKKYLVPKSRAKHGLKASDVQYSDKMLRKIAEEYAREAGVRNFEKALDKIHRKIAYEIVTSDVKRPVRLNDSLLIKYLDQPIFREDEILKADKPGMAIGLAWTSMGGDVLAIEAQHIPGKGELKLTGQLGDIMKESASIAFSYIKSISEQYGIPMKFWEKNSIHLHVPEGAVPKDGPSAGITMASSIYSLATGKTIAPGLAMTGELSLLGKVMPIGGLKEKVLAAGRNKITDIIIPKNNKRDLDKLDENVRKGITFHLVSDMTEVIEIAFNKE